MIPDHSAVSRGATRAQSVLPPDENVRARKPSGSGPVIYINQDRLVRRTDTRSV